MNPITQSTVQSYCRICLSNIEQKSKKTYTVQSISILLYECTGVLCNCFGEELLPQRICVICHSRLLSLSKFQKLAQQSAEFLNKLVRTKETQEDASITKENARVEEEIEGSVFNSEREKEIIEDAKNDDPLEANDALYDTLIDVREVEKQNPAMTDVVSISDHRNKRVKKKNDKGDQQAVSSESGSSEENLYTIIHQENRNTFKCKICPRTLQSRGHFERHFRAFHKDSIKIYSCDQCSLQFSSRKTLQKHIRTAHVKHKCPTCKEEFNVINDLNAHKSAAHPWEYPFVCEICNYSCSRRRIFEQHMKSHKNNLRLKCRTCGIVTSSSEDLKEHRVQYHLTKLCAECGRSFNSASHLRDHYNVVHLKLLPYKCTICDKAFGRAYHLHEHELRHSKERTQTCDICQEKFINRGALSNHMATHRNADTAV